MSDTPGLVFLEDMESRQKQPGFFRLYGKLILLLFLAVSGAVALWMITRGAFSYRVAVSEYERLRNNHVRMREAAYESDPAAASSGDAEGEDQPDASGKTALRNVPVPLLEIDFEALCKINPDTAAWLHVPALNISYPVVYAKDREYYTKHTFEKTRNANGAVFIEPFNRADFTDQNTFLYGHNSADGAMFGALHTLVFPDTKTADHPWIRVYLKDGSVLTYRIYSFYVAKEDGESFRTIDESAYDGYVLHTKQEAQKDLPASFEGRPPLLTLSTCYGETGTHERFLVHAVRVP